MSEMLGNQYFLSRKYCEALRELEESLLKNPSNKSIKKKLIICYVMAGKVYTALELFEQLITEDIYFIINTDPILDDCPCPEIIYEIENSSVYVDVKERRQNNEQKIIFSKHFKVCGRCRCWSYRIRCFSGR